MSKTLTITDKSYRNLEELARLRGFQSVEQFLEEDLQIDERRAELTRRQELGREIRDFQKKTLEKYGVMPDSAEIIREDRAR